MSPTSAFRFGAVEVGLSAAFVREAGDLEDVALEQTERVGHGEHDRRHAVVERLRAARRDRP
jgi:hypothetical protein